MESFGIPCKIIHMVQMLYEDSECAVLDEGEESEWFKVKTGVINKEYNIWIYLLDSSGLDNEKHNSRKQNRDKMELHIKTRGPGLC